MLAKNPNLEITGDNPFANDKLERRQLAENLTHLVQSTKQPFVISIEAPWGWGKTTFIEMWKKHLESQGNRCLYFNAWSNDFVDDPLTAFVAEMSSFVDSTARDAKGGGKIRESLVIFKKVGAGVLRKSLPLAIQLLTQGLISQETVKGAAKFASEIGDEVAKFAGELAEERIKQYEMEKKGIEEFKKSLKNLADLIATESGNKPPLVFFVDELDRCRPDYAIVLLERIKHLFNVEGVVFILAIDREQIEYSIKSIYGSEMKVDGYLRRFIDFSLRLPTPSTDNLCKFLYARFGLDEVFGTQQLPYNETFLRTFTTLANTYTLSPRVIEQCFTDMNLVLRTAPIKPEYFSEFLAFVVALRAHDLETYKRLETDLSRDDINKILERFKKDINTNDPLFKWLLPALEVFFLLGYLSYDENEKILAEFRQVVAKEKGNETEIEYANRVIGLLHKRLYSDDYRKVMKDIISWLDVFGKLSFDSA